MALKLNNFFSEINCSKTTSYSESLLIKLSFKENRCSSPNPVEVIGIFPEAFPNCTIFRFHAKNDQMTKRKYRIYKYHLQLILCWFLKIKTQESAFYKLQNGTHFNNFWKSRGSSLLRAPYFGKSLNNL